MRTLVMSMILSLVLSTGARAEFGGLRIGADGSYFQQTPLQDCDQSAGCQVVFKKIPPGKLLRIDPGRCVTDYQGGSGLNNQMMIDGPGGRYPLPFNGIAGNVNLFPIYVASNETVSIWIPQPGPGPNTASCILSGTLVDEEGSTNVANPSGDGGTRIGPNGSYLQLTPFKDCRYQQTCFVTYKKIRPKKLFRGTAGLCFPTRGLPIVGTPKITTVEGLDGTFAQGARTSIDIRSSDKVVTAIQSYSKSTWVCAMSGKLLDAIN